MCEFETPIFVYYSHIAVFILSLLTGFIILFKDIKHPANRNAFYFLLVLGLWMIDDLVQWTAHDIEINFFAARISPMADLFFLFFLYFSYAFSGIKLSLKRKITFGLPYVILFFLCFTNYNIIFNSDCSYSHTLFMSLYFYLFEIFYTVWSIYILIKYYKNPIIPLQTRMQIKVLVSAISIYTIWGIVYEEIGRISILNNNFIDNTPHFITGVIFFISLIAFAIIKQNLFECDSVLTTGFTVFIWSFMFLILVLFPMDINSVVISSISYIALMAVFRKM